ncbi:Ubx3 protein [Martiniozyma asiatica (nom. inval.)]|nr:Ubx3 protein [Martiniozyma asiatica]
MIMETLQSEYRRFTEAINSLVGIIRWDNVSPTTDSAANVVNAMPGALQPSLENQPPVTNPLNSVLRIVTLSILLILFLPLYWIYRVVVYVIFFIVSIVSKVQSSSSQNGYRTLKSQDPDDVAKQWVIQFDNRMGFKSETQQQGENEGLIYEPSIEYNRPDFIECAYTNALYLVKNKLCFLLVYIDSPLCPQSEQFASKILTNSKFLDFIKGNNVLIWGGDATESQGFQVCNQFNVTRLPFLGLLCLTRQEIPTSSGVTRGEPILSLVSKIQGIPKNGVNDVIRKLEKAINKWQNGVQEIRNERGLTDSSHIQGVQRHVSSNASTGIEPVVAHGAVTTNANLSLLTEEEKRIQYLKYRCRELSECFWDNNSENPIHLAIRFPNGTRREIYLPLEFTLDDLYAYVDIIMRNIEVSSEEEEVHLPEGYTHIYDFQLATSFPRKVLPHGGTFEEAVGGWRSGLLVVEKL